METENKLSKLTEVARAYYLENRTQEEISRSLGISRSQVSRYLTEARQEGIIQICIMEPYTCESSLGKKLQDRYPHLNHVVVAPVFDSSPEAVRSIVGRYAANFLLDTLQPGQKLALGCGRTLEAMVRALPEKVVSNITVIQAMGNLGHEAHKIDYNEIARTAAEKLGGNMHTLSAPAILGKDSVDAETFIQSNQMLQKALAIAKNADVCMAGIGSMESDVVYTQFGLIHPDELNELRGLAVGDILGHFFDINGIKQATAFESRLVGISLDDLHKIPASIIVGGGLDKVAPLLGAIRGKFVNALVSDEQTIHSLLALDESQFNQ